MRKLLKKQKNKPKKQRQSFRLQRKKDRPVRGKIVPVRRILRESAQLLKQNWKLYTGLTLVYAVGYRLLVEGLSRVDFNDVRNTLNDAGTTTDRLSETIVLTSAAFNSASTSTTSTESSLFAGLITLVGVLCVVWATRYLVANEKIRIRDALYNGPGPLLSSLAITFIIALQVLPMTFALVLYGMANSGGFVQGGVENLILFIVTVLASVLTCYWLSSSLMALVAVTLPGMYPMAAMRAARKLVHYRRLQIFMRIAIFALIAAMVWLVLIVITVSNPLTRALVTEIVDLLRGATVVLATVFMYKLYRSLVDEQAEQEAS